MNNKKKLAIIIDAPNWAFHSVAKLIQKELKNIAIVDIFAFQVEPYNNDLYSLLEDVKEYDYIHFLWRKNLLEFNSNGFKQKLIENNLSYDEYVSYFSKKISTAVYDHMFLSNKEINEYKDVFNKFSRKYYTSSKKLYDIYNNIKEYPNPTTTLIDTFDINQFYPMNISRFENSNIKDKPLILGWVGNSGWNSKDGKNIDYKGLHSILEPVINDLINEGYNIEKFFADRQVKAIPNDEMPLYYKEIDVYITCSYQEGTPRPVLEALACGVPIIATDVGIVPEVLGNLQKEFIIGDRTKNSDDIIKKNLKNAIIKLYNNRNLLKELSDENISQSKKFDSSNYKELYTNFFLS